MSGDSAKLPKHSAARNQLSFAPKSLSDDEDAARDISYVFLSFYFIFLLEK